MSEWTVVNEAKPEAPAIPVPGSGWEPAGTKPDPKGGRGVIDKLMGIDGPRFQTLPERAVRAIPETIENFMSAGTSAKPGSRELTENLVKPGFDAATIFTPMSRAMTVAKGLAKPYADLPKSTAAKGRRTAAEAMGSAESHYKELDTIGIKLKPEASEELLANIEKELRDKRVRPYLHGNTLEAIKEIGKPVGEFLTVRDLEEVRQILGEVAGVNKQEARSAGIVRDMIDDYIGNIPLAHVVEGKDNLARAKPIIEQARSEYGAAMKSKLIGAEEFKAELSAATSGSGANVANRLRQKMAGILTDPKKSRWFNEEEKKAIEDIARGGRFENYARLLSKLGPSHPLSGWGSALGADLAGGGGLGIATLATGKIAQHIADKAPKNKIEKLQELILRKKQPANATPIGPTEVQKLLDQSMAGAGVKGFIHEGLHQNDQNEI